MTVKQLPIMQIGDTSYFVDERLKEFRNVKNPHDRLTLAEAYAKAKGLDAGFCEVCGRLIGLNIEKFKAQNCTLCESYIETCRGASETITLCQECCQEDFVEQGNRNSEAFYGVMTNNEDREESDLIIGEG